MDAIHQLLALLKTFTDPDKLKLFITENNLTSWIYAILFLIIFSETGLLVGFFLPGDSLLFTCGVLAGVDVLSLPVLLVSLSVAAVVGDAVNYSIGLKMGNRVYEKGNLWFVKYDHLMAAKAFYEKHGGKAIVLARFAPLVRTFTPFVAGVARMNYSQFVWYNIVGGVSWVISMTLAGYLLGEIPWVRANFEMIVIGIVVVSLIPVFWTAFSHWRAKKVGEIGEEIAKD
jgi:membrane-associated protein